MKKITRPSNAASIVIFLLFVLIVLVLASLAGRC